MSALWGKILPHSPGIMLSNTPFTREGITFVLLIIYDNSLFGLSQRCFHSHRSFSCIPLRAFKVKLSKR